MEILHPARIEVSLKQLRKNIQIIRNLIGKRLYCLPLKANAYGHGICEVAETAQIAGVDYFAVACLSEAILLREKEITKPILVLSPLQNSELFNVSRYDLEISISSIEQVKQVQKATSLGPIRTHIRIDTGMHCTGVRLCEMNDLFQVLQKTPSIDVRGIYSHFATADAFNDSFAQKQWQEFQRTISHPYIKKSKLLRHICNSGGMFFFPEAQLDMVRPGLMTFGILSTDSLAQNIHVAPCFELHAQVCFSKIVQKGKGIGYGQSYILSKDARIVTIPIGYGDGYLRALSNKGEVLIRGKRFPIVGHVCMDQLMVNVGDQDIQVGEDVVLIGKQGNEEIAVTEIAKLAQTIPYEVLCLFKSRLQRKYLR